MPSESQERVERFTIFLRDYNDPVMASVDSIESPLLRPDGPDDEWVRYSDYQAAEARAGAAERLADQLKNEVEFDRGEVERLERAIQEVEEELGRWAERDRSSREASPTPSGRDFYLGLIYRTEAALDLLRSRVEDSSGSDLTICTNCDGIDPASCPFCDDGTVPRHTTQEGEG